MKKLIKLVNTNETAFIITIIGTITQTIHTTFLAYGISPLTGYSIVIESALLGLFFSLGLVFFTIKAGFIIIYELDDNKTKAKKQSEIETYLDYATYFMYFEMFVNIFYWIAAIIFIPYFKDKNVTLSELQNVAIFKWFQLIAGIIFAIALPAILKMFAGQIKSKDEKFEISLTKELIQLKENVEEIKNKKLEVIVNGVKYEITNK